MKEYMDAVTNPQIAVPVVGTASFLSWFADVLPVLINVGSFIYIILVIIHKAWKMYKEWKTKDESSE
jgi:hypothetical protein